MSQWPSSDIDQSVAAVIHEKEDNFWIYHRSIVEDDEEEKQHPADKAWIIVKFANQQPASPYHRGYKLRIGDTIKFGRVRFKVIMLSNEVDGDQVFKETRFNNSNSSKKEKKGINIMPMASRMSLGNTVSDDEIGEEEDPNDIDQDDNESDSEDEEHEVPIDGLEDPIIEERAHSLFNSNNLEGRQDNHSRFVGGRLNNTNLREFEYDQL